jgi:hypothetical protein
MTDQRITVVGLILAVILLPAAAFADGGGGFFYGLQTTEYPFLQGYPIRNNSLGLMYTGGFGYGMSGSEVTGGFGVGLSDFEHKTGGGYGGVIHGFRGVLGPVNLLLTSWTGIGGLKYSEALSGDTHSYLIFTEEIDLELGLAILPWFMPMLYAGYQVMGNLYPEKPFRGFFSYTPVVGVRFAWGRFR